jgi:hypothetical protein
LPLRFSSLQAALLVDWLDDEERPRVFSNKKVLETTAMRARALKSTPFYPIFSFLSSSSSSSSSSISLFPDGLL